MLWLDTFDILPRSLLIRSDTLPFKFQLFLRTRKFEVKPSIHVMLQDNFKSLQNLVKTELWCYKFSLLPDGYKVVRCTAWFDDDNNTRTTGINTLFDFLLKHLSYVYLARCINNWTQLMLIPQPESAKPANIHLIETSLTYLHHQLVVSCSVIFLIEFISEV